MTDVVLLTGMPNSGTTILNVILGNHATIFSAGNLLDFPDHGYFSAHKRCSCGSNVASCEFWTDLRASIGGIPKEARARFLYERIAEKTGAQTVVDVTHDLDQLRAALAVPGVQRKVIHIIREPAAVIRSRLGWDASQGRHAGTVWWELKRVAKLGRRWRRQVSATERIVRQLGPTAALTLRYEQLGSSPAAQIARLAAFLDKDFTPIARKIAAGEPLAIPPHFVRGNGKVVQQHEIILRFDRRQPTDEARWRRWITGAMTRTMRLGA